MVLRPLKMSEIDRICPLIATFPAFYCLPVLKMNPTGQVLTRKIIVVSVYEKKKAKLSEYHRSLFTIPRLSLTVHHSKPS